ncbi:MAG: glycosyltransferase family 39 protein [Parcubacteria group bacterium]
MRHWIPITVCVLLLVGVGIRMFVGAERYLWQDEAETVINSLQVLEDGYPHGKFEGKPLFENSSTILSNDPKYAYESTNYYGSTFERNKGWLTYGYQAIFLKLFGFSEKSARWPFAALFAFSGLAIFYMGKKFFSTTVGVLALGMYAVNYGSILFEYQSRYYALVIMLTLFGLITMYRALTTRSWTWYMLTALMLILQFHTSVVSALAMIFFFILMHVKCYRPFRSSAYLPLLVVLLLIMLAALPWILMVRFGVVFSLYHDYTVRVLWLILVGVIVLTLTVLRRLFPVQLTWNLTAFEKHLWFFIAIAVAVKPLVAPAESVAARLFVELTPIFTLLIAKSIYSLIQRTKTPWYHLIHQGSQIAVIMVVFFVLNIYFGNHGVTRTDWIEESITYLSEHPIEDGAPLFVSYQYFPFALYTNYNVDPIWPIRKSYIDAYPGTLYFLFYNNFTTSQDFNQGATTSVEELNYYQRLQKCQKNEIADKTILYECPGTPVPSTL